MIGCGGWSPIIDLCAKHFLRNKESPGDLVEQLFFSSLATAIAKKPLLTKKSTGEKAAFEYKNFNNMKVHKKVWVPSNHWCSERFNSIASSYWTG